MRVLLSTLVIALGGLGASYAAEPKTMKDMKSNLDFQRRLLERSLSKITFVNEEARKAVYEFNVPCRGGRRYIPLINIIAVDVALSTRVRAVVDRRGGETRITYVVQPTEKLNGFQALTYQISRWDELTSPTGDMQAIMWRCTGDFGPIWLE